jgi:hypothetical protein
MRYRDFTREIIDAYEHRGGTRTMCLGILEEEWFHSIQAECAWICNNAGSSDVLVRTHVTNWTRPRGAVRQFSLFNTSGDSADTAGDYGHLGDASKKRLVFPHLDGITRLARLFGPRLRNLRLNGIGPNSSLGAHEENSISVTAVGRVFILRFHLPVFTNPGAMVFLDDEAYHYEEGRIYFFHHGCVHAAANRGDAPRYHLVLDCFLNRDLFSSLFPGTASPDPGFRKNDLAGARMTGAPHHFLEFVSEGGHVIRGPIDYGRHIPRRTGYYRKRYPSLFRFLPGTA